MQKSVIVITGLTLTLLAVMCSLASVAAQSSQPDLAITSNSVPATFNARSTVTMTWTVKNQGTAATTSSWYDYVYLSTDQILDTSTDTVLMSYYQSALAAGASFTASQSASIPQLSAGNYYVIILVDRSNNVHESDETNNQVVVPVTVTDYRPDLVITSESVPSSVNTRSYPVITWTVKNQGTRDTFTNLNDYMYLSTDQTLDVATDTVLATYVPYSSVAAGSSYTANPGVYVPQVAAGNYYLIIVVDKNNNVFESDETNNQVVVPVTVTDYRPDLTIISESVPSTVNARSSPVITWTVKNQGTRDTFTNWYDYIYLSTDQTLDTTTDTFITSYNTYSTAAAGTSYTANSGVSIPQVAAGNYYLIIVTDKTNTVFESDETNNQVVVPVTITDNRPDLAIVFPSVPSTFSSHTPITVSWNVKNQGTRDTFTNWWDYLYLSTDQTLDTTTDTLLAGLSPPSITAGNNIKEITKINIATTGNYYLIIVVDKTDTVYESDETNNQLAIPVSIIEPTGYIQINANSHVNIIVTDGNGYRVGYDSTSGTVVNEVGGATYTGAGTTPQTVKIPITYPGTFSIQAYGTDSGSYTLTVTTQNLGGSTLDTESWAQTATTSVASGKSVNVAADGTITEGVFVMPEYGFGGLIAFAACLAATAVFVSKRQFKAKMPL